MPPTTHQSPSSRFAALFIDHPASVDETYLQHMRFALRFAGLLAVASVCALVHALVPALCKSTASTIIRRLYERCENRDPAGISD